MSLSVNNNWWGGRGVSIPLQVNIFNTHGYVERPWYIKYFGYCTSQRLDLFVSLFVFEILDECTS